MPANNRYKLQVRFGDDLLEAGFTAVPNLFLINYGDLGISDGAALWIVHLLRFKWTEDNPYPRRSSIPINASKKTQIRYARDLRKLGFLFSRRKHWSKEDNPPDPDLVGKVRALEYDFTSLFYNVVRISHWKAEGKLLDKFEVEIPHEIVEKVASGYFHDVPQQWQQLCEQLARANQDKPTDQPAQNGQVGDPESQPTQNGQVETEDQPTQNGYVDPQDQPTQIGQVDQPTQNDPLYNKDSLYKEGSEKEKEEQQQNTWPPAAAVVVPLDEMDDLHLQDDQVVVALDSNGSNFATIPIFEVVRHELRRRRSEPFYEAGTYYSVQHALGEGPDDWTDEELDRIRRKQALERELGQRYMHIGAFTLEEALQQYFTSQLTTEILEDKPASELARIEGCVTYIRQQKNLTNPAGLLRILIESGETPPLSQPEASDSESSFPVTPVGRRLPGRESDEEASAGEARPDRAPDLEIPDSEVTSRQLWDAALGELQLQMPRTTFDTWLKSTYIARIEEEDNFTIRCANPYAKDWLENRLDPKITRTLAGILGRPVTVEYEAVT